MAPKHHHIPLSGGDRKALKKELSKSRAMTRIFAERSAEKRREGEALIREADNLACQSWNERCGATAAPSIRARQSIKRSTAASHGWKSNARGARPRATLTSARYATCRRHACTISSDGWFVRSARRPESGQPRRCSSLRRASDISRRATSIASFYLPSRRPARKELHDRNFCAQIGNTALIT